MKIWMIFLLMLCVCAEASAEIITLKDGRRVSGKIVLQDKDQLKLDVKGVAMTFYLDEIDQIDGKSVAKPSQEAVKPIEEKIPSQEAPAAPRVTSTAPVAEAPVSPAQKKELILKFIEVFGTRAAMTANFNSIIDTIAQEKPEEARQIRERFKVDAVIERLIPLYDKYFTAEDLKAYIEFYGSPQGRKLNANIGLVMKDSVEVGAAYIKETFPELDR